MSTDQEQWAGLSEPERAWAERHKQSQVGMLGNVCLHETEAWPCDAIFFAQALAAERRKKEALKSSLSALNTAIRRYGIQKSREGEYTLDRLMELFDCLQEADALLKESQP